jgi:hypothetical protein
LTFACAEDYEKLAQGDRLRIDGVHAGLASGEMTLVDETNGARIPLTCAFTERQAAILKYGGLLAYTKACPDRA